MLNVSYASVARANSLNKAKNPSFKGELPELTQEIQRILTGGNPIAMLSNLANAFQKHPGVNSETLAVALEAAAKKQSTFHELPCPVGAHTSTK